MSPAGSTPNLLTASLPRSPHHWSTTHLPQVGDNSRGYHHHHLHQYQHSSHLNNNSNRNHHQFTSGYRTVPHPGYHSKHQQQHGGYKQPQLAGALSQQQQTTPEQSSRDQHFPDTPQQTTHQLLMQQQQQSPTTHVTSPQQPPFYRSQFSSGDRRGGGGAFDSGYGASTSSLLAPVSCASQASRVHSHWLKSALFVLKLVVWGWGWGEAGSAGVVGYWLYVLDLSLYPFHFRSNFLFYTLS